MYYSSAFGLALRPEILRCLWLTACALHQPEGTPLCTCMYVCTVVGTGTTNESRHPDPAGMTNSTGRFEWRMGPDGCICRQPGLVHAKLCSTHPWGWPSSTAPGPLTLTPARATVEITQLPQASAERALNGPRTATSLELHEPCAPGRLLDVSKMHEPSTKISVAPRLGSTTYLGSS